MTAKHSSKWKSYNCLNLGSLTLLGHSSDAHMKTWLRRTKNSSAVFSMRYYLVLDVLFHQFVSMTCKWRWIQICLRSQCCGAADDNLSVKLHNEKPVTVKSFKWQCSCVMQGIRDRCVVGSVGAWCLGAKKAALPVCNARWTLPLRSVRVWRIAQHCSNKGEVLPSFCG